MAHRQHDEARDALRRLQRQRPRERRAPVVADHRHLPDADHAVQQAAHERRQGAQAVLAHVGRVRKRAAAQAGQVRRDRGIAGGRERGLDGAPHRRRVRPPVQQQHPAAAAVGAGGAVRVAHPHRDAARRAARQLQLQRLRLAARLLRRHAVCVAGAVRCAAGFCPAAAADAAAVAWGCVRRRQRPRAAFRCCRSGAIARSPRRAPRCQVLWRRGGLLMACGGTAGSGRQVRGTLP